jgi:hypothetical protein
MYEALKSRLAALLRRPRAMKPQAQRQILQHLSEHSSSMQAFLLCAASVLEDYELDITFGPLFTPTLDERAELADLLYHWRPSAQELQQLVSELSKEVSHTLVLLEDGTKTELSLHEVMLDRFVRLLRLDAGPDPATAAALRDALPAELWTIGVALLCENGMTPTKQTWFVALVNHMSSQHAVTRGLLETTAEFLASQPTLDRQPLLAAAESLLRATEGTAAFASGGHTYWSPDVAQHHHYRGQGRVDKDRVEQQQAELERVTTMLQDLRSFDFGAMQHS